MNPTFSHREPPHLAAAGDHDPRVIAFIPAPAIETRTPHLSPDCAQGKCKACTGEAWDLDLDAAVSCEHWCHALDLDYLGRTA